MAQNTGARRWWLYGFLGALLGGGLLVGLVVYLMQPSTPTARIRDVLIILLVLEGMLLGFLMLVLLVQLGMLLHVLHHEVRPLLESLQETARTMQGTSRFLSEHLARPVIRARSYVAMARSVYGLLRRRGKSLVSRGR